LLQEIGGLDLLAAQPVLVGDEHALEGHWAEGEGREQRLEGRRSSTPRSGMSTKR
jgi:hypothetical protein